MREPKDWDEEYLLNLPIGEFDWLEVKGRRGLDLTLSSVDENDVKSIMSKAISAFANSGGGNLVFGLANPNKKWQIDDGGIDLAIKKPNTREWLEDIIPTLVDFPLSSFNVYAIQGKGSSSQIAEGRAVFVIEIPDSEQAPHQAIDNRYYIRVGGKSKPISHRLVTDIFGRRSYPKIQLEFIAKSTLYYENSFRMLSGTLSLEENPKKRKWELIIRAVNSGKVFAQYVNCFVRIPAPLIPTDELRFDYKNADDFEEIDGVKYVEWSKSNTRRDVLKAEPFGVNQYGTSWFDPILPNLSFGWDWDIFEGFDKEKHGDLKIIWDVYADNAPPQSGHIFVKDIEVVYEEDESD
ncbi:MAG: ATP-binding protein [Anaerolineales bacterium]|nr:ATP-binding protein [Anaerolineales bacterium]